METAVVAGVISVPLGIAIIVLALVVRSQAKDVAAANAKALANGEAQLEQERELDAVVAREKETAAKLTFEQARADEAADQLADTQRALNTATLELAAVEQERVLGMTNEQAFEVVKQRLRTPLSARGATALEKP